MNRRLQVLARLLLPDVVFLILWGMMLVGVFELFWDAYVAGAVIHPIWGTLVPWLPHHMYLVHGAMLVSWFSVRGFMFLRTLKMLRGK